jgi:hypothetical protein
VQAPAFFIVALSWGCPAWPGGEDDYDHLVAALAPTTCQAGSPDVALLGLAVTAFDLACPPDAEPLEYDELRERYCPR